MAERSEPEANAMTAAVEIAAIAVHWPASASQLPRKPPLNSTQSKNEKLNPLAFKAEHLHGHPNH